MSINKYSCYPSPLSLHWVLSKVHSSGGDWDLHDMYYNMSAYHNVGIDIYPDGITVFLFKTNLKSYMTINISGIYICL